MGGRSLPRLKIIFKVCSYVQDTDEKFPPLGQNPKNKLWLAQPHQTEPQSKLKPISNPKLIQNLELDLHKLAAVCPDQNRFSKDIPMFRIPMKNLHPWDRTPKKQTVASPNPLK